MRSRTNASFDWATISGACTSFDSATFSGGNSSFYDATFSGREVLRSPGVNNCVFDWTRRSDADGETVHQPPVAMPDCIRPREWLQRWDPFASLGVNGGRTG
jgi:hypothetical protein